MFLKQIRPHKRPPNVCNLIRTFGGCSLQPNTTSYRRLAVRLVGWYGWRLVCHAATDLQPDTTSYGRLAVCPGCNLSATKYDLIQTFGRPSGWLVRLEVGLSCCNRSATRYDLIRTFGRPSGWLVRLEVGLSCCNRSATRYDLYIIYNVRYTL